MLFAWLVTALAPRVVHAQTELRQLEAVHEACEEARRRARKKLYVLVADEVRLRAYDSQDELLTIDTRRNLRALEGRVSVLLSGLEPITFEVQPERARELMQATARGATLRLGFFLGFDDATRQPCVRRGPHAVTVLRADLAFAELSSRGGEQLARMETDRLRAWLDDEERRAIPGEGPRGVVETARFDNATPAPENWQRALESAAIRERLGHCHAEGVARGAAAEGRVIVRLNIETRTGRIRRADVALSTLGDEGDGQCIARALGSAELAPGPASWRAEVVDLTVPVRLASD